MEIKAITIRDGHMIKSQSKECETFLNLRNNVSINKEIVVHVLSDNGLTYTVDLFRMFDDHSDMEANWISIEDHIVQGDFTIYRSFLPIQRIVLNKVGDVNHYEYSDSEIDLTKQVKMIPIEKLPSIDVKIGSIRVPDDIDNILYNGISNDIRIRIEKSDESKISLENSVCVINGRLFFSTMYQGDMWVTQCVRHLRQTSGEAFFIDFSNLGGRTIYRFNDIGYELLNPSFENKTCKGTVKLTLPYDHSFVGKTPLLVVEGRLFLPNEFNYNNNIVNFDISDMPIEAMLISDYGENTDTIGSAGTNTNIILQDVIERQWSSPDYEGSFLIVVNSELLIETRPLYNNFLKNMIFDKTFVDQTLIVSNSNRNFVNYVQDEYNDRFSISFRTPKDQMLIDRDSPTVLTYGRDDPRMGSNLGHGRFISMNISKR